MFCPDLTTRVSHFDILLHVYLSSLALRQGTRGDAGKLRVVSGVFAGCLRGASGVFVGCFRDTSGVFPVLPGCFRGASGCVRGVPGVLPGCSRGVPFLLRFYFWVFRGGAAGVLGGMRPGCCRGAARVPPGAAGRRVVPWTCCGHPNNPDAPICVRGCVLVLMPVSTRLIGWYSIWRLHSRTGNLIWITLLIQGCRSGASLVSSSVLHTGQTGDGSCRTTKT